MSVLYGKILRMNDIKENWFKYNFVCPYCDSLIEYTTKDLGTNLEQCPICPNNLTLMSVVDATIDPTKKEEQTMETQTIPSDLDIAKENNIRLNDKLMALYNKINKLENILISSAENADEDMLELIKDIANTFDIALTKEIEVTGTMSFSARITVPLTEDYDLQDYSDFVVTSYDTNSDVYDYSMDNVEEVY